MSQYLPADPPADPWELLHEWLPSNEHPDRPQLILSTVNDRGEPDARTLLLTEFDDQGFYFHTDARSRKVANITANPAVAITLLGPAFTRQLVIQGRAEVASPTEISSAYRRRSPYLQQLAWLNTHDYAQLPHEERRARWAEFLAEHSPGEGLPGEFDQPDTWIGFLVRPHRLTFWGSDPHAASRRAEYTLVDGGWVLEFLPG